MAQSIRVRSKQTWRSVTLWVDRDQAGEIRRKRSPGFLMGSFDNDWFDEYRSDYSTGAGDRSKCGAMTARAGTGTFDLTQGFTRVHRSRCKRSDPSGAGFDAAVQEGCHGDPW